MPNMITITLDEYNDLLETQLMYECMVAAGVDSWEGYEVAQAIFDADNEADEEDIETTKTVH